MNGNDELRKLSTLLGLGANTARRMASITIVDKNQIQHLADRAGRIADELQSLTATVADLPRIP